MIHRKIQSKLFIAALLFSITKNFYLLSLVQVNTASIAVTNKVQQQRNVCSGIRTVRSIFIYLRRSDGHGGENENKSLCIFLTQIDDSPKNIFCWVSFDVSFRANMVMSFAFLRIVRNRFIGYSAASASSIIAILVSLKHNYLDSPYNQLTINNFKIRIYTRAALTLLH